MVSTVPHRQSWGYIWGGAVNQRAPEKNDFLLELNKKHSPGNNEHAVPVTPVAYLILSNLFGYDCILCRNCVM